VFLLSSPESLFTEGVPGTRFQVFLERTRFFFRLKCGIPYHFPGLERTRKVATSVVVMCQSGFQVRSTSCIFARRVAITPDSIDVVHFDNLPHFALRATRGILRSLIVLGICGGKRVENFWPAIRSSSQKSEGWGGKPDLNRRPPVPQTGALTN